MSANLFVCLSASLCVCLPVLLACLPAPLLAHLPICLSVASFPEQTNRTSCLVDSNYLDETHQAGRNGHHIDSAQQRTSARNTNQRGTKPIKHGYDFDLGRINRAEPSALTEIIGAEQTGQCRHLTAIYDFAPG